MSWQRTLIPKVHTIRIVTNCLPGRSALRLGPLALLATETSGYAIILNGHSSLPQGSYQKELGSYGSSSGSALNVLGNVSSPEIASVYSRATLNYFGQELEYGRPPIHQLRSRQAPADTPTAPPGTKSTVQLGKTLV